MSLADAETRAALEDAKALRAKRLAQQERRIRELHAKGYSSGQMAQIVGLSASRVNALCREFGLPSNGAGVEL